MAINVYRPPATWLLLSVLLLIHSATSFLPMHKLLMHSASTTTNTLLCLTPQEDNYSKSSGQWKLKNDFPLFLNQITIQSLMVVMTSIRDVQTVRWLHNFTQPAIIPSTRERASVRLTGTTPATQSITNATRNPDGFPYSKLLTYHGLGAINTTLFPTWESYFANLLETPVQSLLIQSSSIQVKDYELDINPPSLCSRLISVREQLAEEMAYDLQVVANMGYHTMDSYWEYLDEQRDKEVAPSPSLTPKRVVEIGTAEEDDQDEPDKENRSSPPLPGPIQDEVTMSSGDDKPRRLPPHNLVFLDYSLDDEGDRRPSSLRKGNFDLVVLLATQEAIHRILNGENQQEEAGKDFRIYQQFLVDFYAKRMDSHFTGIQRYGRADDFLEELLFSSPRVSTDAGFAALVDPVRVAEMILKERRQVALEWSAKAKNVPTDHIAIKRLQLDALMRSYQ